MGVLLEREIFEKGVFVNLRSFLISVHYPKTLIKLKSEGVLISLDSNVDDCN